MPNYSAPQGNITSTVDVFSWVNGIVDNWFFQGMLLAVWAIIFIKMLFNQTNTAGKSFAASSFVMMIISVMCRLLGFISTAFMSLFIIATVAGALWMYIEDRQ